MNTQVRNIELHLLAGKTITPIEALHQYGIFRLAARVCELRDAGYEILTEMETDGVKQWARYALVRSPAVR